MERIKVFSAHVLLFLQHITKRIQEVGRNFRLRILLVFVDDESNLAVLQELNKLAFACDFTLVLAWSNAECARYIETFKAFEGKSAAAIQEKVETEFMPRLTSILTSIRSVNKTDVATLMGVFDAFGNICRASEEELAVCPGLGEKKVKRLHKILHEPFLPAHLQTKKPRTEESSNAAIEANDGES
jgi:DNA excision repair protein ERCC-1